MKPITHPLVVAPRRLYELDNGLFLVLGGILYSEDGCECGKSGIKQAACANRDIGKALELLEAHERKHVRPTLD